MLETAAKKLILLLAKSEPCILMINQYISTEVINMASIPKESIGVLRSAPEVQSVAYSSEDERVVVASAINNAANCQQLSCIVERSLKPETIQDLIDNGYTLEHIGRADSSKPIIIDWGKSVVSSVACDYTEVPQNSPIYNTKELEDVFWVKLPAITSNFLLDSLDQIQPATNPVSALPEIMKENIWLRIPTSLLDTTVGNKIYKVGLSHKCLEDTMTVYFGYTIQNDDPDKPYVYMK